MDLEDFMTPKAQELRAKYENARIAVNMGWTISSKQYSSMEELATTARWISKEIENDLNATLKILETAEASNGAKSESPKVSRAN